MEKESVLKEAMTLKLQFGSGRRWKGALDWGKANFAITPKENANRIEIDWNVYRGQHWRKPVLFVAREDAKIKPGEQQVLGVSSREEDFEGLSFKKGIVSPVRDFSVMTNNYGVAYAYGQDMDKILVMNLSNENVTIKKGTKVAELHPRSLEDFELLSTQGTPCDSIGKELSRKAFGDEKVHPSPC